MGYFDNLKQPDPTPAPPPPSTGGTVVELHRRHGDLHPYAAAVIRYELDRLDRLPRPWHEGAGWDTTTFEVACNLLEIANAPWSGYTPAQAEHDLYSHAPADQRWGRREHDQKLNSARQRVGAASRPEPRPDERFEPDITEVRYAELMPPAPETTAEQPDEPLEATWAPVPLDDVLDGTWTPTLPSLMPRNDGCHLLYPGHIHSFHGESESGKSLVAQAEAARLLRGGHRVLFIDFESDKASVVGRLLELGATREHVRDGFTYLRPDVDPRNFVHEREALRGVLSTPYALCVIDGVTEALGIFGASTKDNDDITKWMRLLPRTVAKMTGAAVVLIDHVTKDTDGRGRFAIGGQAKMAALDGAAYVVEVVEALGRGRLGQVVLRVAKDRPGGVRAHAGDFRKTDRTQEAARIVIDSSRGDELIHVTVRSPREGGEEFRPTHLMELVSLLIEEADEAVSVNHIEHAIPGKAQNVRAALALLIREHYVHRDTGARRALMHTSIQPYREARDPKSDRYIQEVQ